MIACLPAITGAVAVPALTIAFVFVVKALRWREEYRHALVLVGREWERAEEFAALPRIRWTWPQRLARKDSLSLVDESSEICYPDSTANEAKEG